MYVFKPIVLRYIDIIGTQDGKLQSNIRVIYWAFLLKLHRKSLRKDESWTPLVQCYVMVSRFQYLVLKNEWQTVDFNKEV
jgi:hypothetical protein